MTEDSISQKLSELFDLYKSGALTKEEYEKLKKQILSENGIVNAETEKKQEQETVSIHNKPIGVKKGSKNWIFALTGIVLIVVAFFVLKTEVFTNKSVSRAKDVTEVKSPLTDSKNDKTYKYYKVKDKSISVDKVPPAGLYLCKGEKGNVIGAINIIIKDGIVRFQTGENKDKLVDADANMDENGNIDFSGDYGYNEYKGNGVLENSSLYFNGNSPRTVNFIKENTDVTQVKGTVTDSRNGKIYKTITDIEGNVYKIVTIGRQVWMAENLKTTKLNDGTAIPLVTGNTPWTEWSKLTTPAYCWYNNDAANKDTYGALYNWYAVSTFKLCPQGWHVPTPSEWSTLAIFLGDIDSSAVGKLKETGTSHWLSPNTGATNSSGFTALPGGYRYQNGQYFNLGQWGYWWNAAVENSHIFFSSDGLEGSNNRVQVFSFEPKQTGQSVRCLRDF